MNIFEKTINYIMPRKKSVAVPAIVEVPAAEVGLAASEMQKMMEAMAAKEAAQTYRLLHVFDNEVVIVRGKGLDLKQKVSDVKTETNFLLQQIVAKGNNSFEKNEIKTVNVTNDSNIVVFVKDKDMLRIEYGEFDSSVIEALVNAVKNIGNQ